MLLFAASSLLPRYQVLLLPVPLATQFQSTHLLPGQRATHGGTLQTRRDPPNIPDHCSLVNHLPCNKIVVYRCIRRNKFHTSENREQIFDIASRTISCSDEKQLVSIILLGLVEENHFGPDNCLDICGEGRRGWIHVSLAGLTCLRERGKRNTVGACILYRIQPDMEGRCDQVSTLNLNRLPLNPLSVMTCYSAINSLIPRLVSALIVRHQNATSRNTLNKDADYAR